MRVLTMQRFVDGSLPRAAIFGNGGEDLNRRVANIGDGTARARLDVTVWILKKFVEWFKRARVVQAAQRIRHAAADLGIVLAASALTRAAPPSQVRLDAGRIPLAGPP